MMTTDDGGGGGGLAIDDVTKNFLIFGRFSRFFNDSLKKILTIFKFFSRNLQNRKDNFQVAS